MLTLRSKPRREALAYFYRNPKARVYVRRLALQIGVDSTNLSRELAALAREGFLRGELEGRQLYYSINPHYRNLRAVMDLMSEFFAEESAEPPETFRARKEREALEDKMSRERTDFYG